MKSSIHRLCKALAVAFALSTIAVPSALAKPHWAVVDGGDSFSRGCRSLVDKAKDLEAEYGSVGTSNARKKDIILELQDIALTWSQIGCKDIFGPIFVTDLVKPGPRPGQGTALPIYQPTTGR